LKRKKEDRIKDEERKERFVGKTRLVWRQENQNSGYGVLGREAGTGSREALEPRKSRVQEACRAAGQGGQGGRGRACLKSW